MRLNWIFTPPKKASAGSFGYLIGRGTLTWRYSPVRRTVASALHCVLSHGRVLNNWFPAAYRMSTPQRSVKPPRIPPMNRCWYSVIWITVVLVGIQLISISLCPCGFCAVASEGKSSDCPCGWGRSAVSVKMAGPEDRRKVAGDSPCLTLCNLLNHAFLHTPQRVIGRQVVASPISEPFAMLCRFVL